MTLQQLKDIIDNLYQNKSNWKKEIIGDIRPGIKLNKVKLYGDHHIALYDEREQ